MHGGGPSPSGSSFRHSYGFAAVSNAHTSAKGRFPDKITKLFTYKMYEIEKGETSHDKPSFPPIDMRYRCPTKAMTCP